MTEKTTEQQLQERLDRIRELLEEIVGLRGELVCALSKADALEKIVNQQSQELAAFRQRDELRAYEIRVTTPGQLLN